MHWSVTSPGPWLIPFVPAGRHEFTFVAPPARRASWHTRKRTVTSGSEWLAVMTYARAVWRKRRGGGVITAFPQLAAGVGLRKRLAASRAPVVAHNFNMGRLYGGTKGRVARFALRGVDRFLVHSRRECARYADWLDLPPERFRFVPLQCGFYQTTLAEDTERPFLLAMGSAHRDYRSLFEAVRRLRIPTVVVAAAHAMNGLDVPEGVEVRSGLTLQECRELAQRARLSVVPVSNDQTASGQVTVVEAMRMGRPVIATRCVGTEDYIESGTNGVLVPLGEAEALAGAVAELWDDAPLRERLAANARRHADEHYSDEAAGAALGRLLDELADGRD